MCLGASQRQICGGIVRMSFWWQFGLAPVVGESRSRCTGEFVHLQLVRVSAFNCRHVQQRLTIAQHSRAEPSFSISTERRVYRAGIHVQADVVPCFSEASVVSSNRSIPKMPLWSLCLASNPRSNRAVRRSAKDLSHSPKFWSKVGGTLTS